MRFSTVLALTGAALVQGSALKGFNYGSTFTDGSYKQQSDFEADFKRATTLQGTSGFNSARLYTMIQGGTTNTVTAAIPAAIATNTKLLLGMWASAGDAAFANELAALKSAISQYGTKFTSLVVGLSVGSEDLYRISPTGIENQSGVGASPQTLVSYIQQTKSAISNTPASGFSIGHVDTWTAFVNSSNDAVISAIDWLGVDSYPYFETTQANSIDNNANLFFQSYNATVGAAGGKDVWITETGYPVSGKTSGQAVPSVENAEAYWQAVGCKVLGNINTFWYTLQDADPTTPNPSFGLIGSDLNSAPLYDLTCKSSSTGTGTSSGSSSAASTATGKSSHATSAASSGATATGTGSGSSATSTSSSGSGGSSGSGSGTSSGSGSSSGSSGSGTSSPSSTSSVIASSGASSGYGISMMAATVAAVLAFF